MAFVCNGIKRQQIYIYGVRQRGESNLWKYTSYSLLIQGKLLVHLSFYMLIVLQKQNFCFGVFVHF